MIKSYTVRYEEVIKTIDNHLRKDAEILVKRNQRMNLQEQVDGFVEGIAALVVEPEESPAEKVERMLESANTEAAEILAKAKEEAEKIKSEAFSSAAKQGYDEGVKKGQMELQTKRSELESEKVRLHQEYEAMRQHLEPNMADIMADLVEKITGVVVEEQRDVILYLIEKAFLGFDRVNEITIRVSSDDYVLVDSKKDYLAHAFGRNVSLHVIEDGILVKNQCKLETENKVIDCSLDVQLKNLIADIKLLGRV